MNTTASLSAGAEDDIQLQPRTDTLRTESSGGGHPLGSYAGVKPGSASAPPVPAPKTESKPMITWPGFQMRQDGTSRVFIQSTSALTPQPSAAPQKFSVHLPGAKISGNTNKLPLETRFFNTPVARVNIEQQRDGVTLVLDLRSEVAPVVSSERGPTGFYFLYIDLPKGQYVKPAPTASEAPSAAPSPNDRTKHLEPASSGSSFTGEFRSEASGSGTADASGGEVKASGRAKSSGTIKLGL